MPAFRRREIAVLVGPAAVVVAGLYLLPLVMNAVLSLFDFTAFRQSLEWVGAGNYLQLDEAGLLVPTVQRTLGYAALSCALMLGAALSLALALEANTRVNRVLRTLFFAPVLLSSLAVGFVFRALLGLDGAVNGFLSIVMGQPVHVPWVASLEWSLTVVSVAVAWRWFPIAFIVFVAGLASIPRELLEAARVEGAGSWALFRHVKMPLLAPAVTFSVVISLITALTIFETVFVLTGGGPGRATEVLNFLVITEFGQGRYGAAAALSTVLYGAIFLCCVPLVARLRGREVQV